MTWSNHHGAGRQLQELALGPYSARSVTITTIHAALRPLAPCLTFLHLNLSSLSRVVHAPTRSSDGAWTTTIIVETLRRQHPKLHHLALRMAPNPKEAETNDPLVEAAEVAMPGVAWPGVSHECTVVLHHILRHCSR